MLNLVGVVVWKDLFSSYRIVFVDDKGFKIFKCDGWMVKWVIFLLIELSMLCNEWDFELKFMGVERVIFKFVLIFCTLMFSWFNVGGMFVSDCDYVC